MSKVAVWALTCVVFLCCQPHLGLTQFDLAQQIFQNVHNSLDGTANIGRNFAPNFNPQSFGAELGQQIFQQVHNNLRGTQNLGSQISKDVQQQLAPLQFLGEKIHQQVGNSLLPVHAMTIKNSIANGVGGITIATYNTNRPRSFVIKDGIRSVCNGNIRGTQCHGYLEPFTINNKEDYCYAKSYASINNRICLSPGPVNVHSYNNQVSCESSDGSPVLRLFQREYHNLCGNRMPWQVVYTYYANPNDARAIPIPNPNPYVICQNNQPGICVFEGKGAGGSGTIASSSNEYSYNYNF